MSDYDKYLLMPIPSGQNSRNFISLMVDLGKDLHLSVPIIGSPMKGIMSFELAKALSEFGGIGILHRFYDPPIDWGSDVAGLRDYNYGVSVPVFDYLSRSNGIYSVEHALHNGAKIICVDVANGYLTSVRAKCLEIANIIEKYNYQALVMSGNVITWDGVFGLAESGTNLIRFGIGTGNLCTTRKVTGIGRDQISGLYETQTMLKTYKHLNPTVKIIADGGINDSGKAVKALAFGANAIMLGTLLGKANESAHNGIIYGMASRKLQEEYYHSVKSVEGIEKEIEKESSLDELLTEFCFGIKSACTYLNASDLSQLRKEGMRQYRKYYYNRRERSW